MPGPWRNEDGEIAEFFRADPILHAATYAAITRLGPSLKVYQTQSNYFPVRYRPEINPYKHLVQNSRPDLERNPPRIDLDAYRQKTGIKPDLVTVWGDDSELVEENLKGLLKSLGRTHRAEQAFQVPGPLTPFRAEGVN